MCSLVIADASAKVIARCDPSLVTIVAMGEGRNTRTDEDEQCALYLRNLLQGRIPNGGAVKDLVLSGESSLQFDDLDKHQFHPMDREIALRIDSYSFAIKVSRRDGLLVAEPEHV